MSDIKNKQNTEGSSTIHENSFQDGDFFKQEEIKQMLEEAGIQNYDSQVVPHLCDYINCYAVDVLDQASEFMNHAGRQAMNLADVKLALNVIAKKSPKRLSQKELMKMAQECNNTQLPECNGVGYLPSLPTDGCVLTKCNYKLKPTNAQFPVNIPLMDMSNRQNSLLTLNTIRGHSGGIPSVICTSSGTMSVNVPLNLNSQRIILKPRTSTSNNVMYTNQNGIENNCIKKRMKFEEIKK